MYNVISMDDLSNLLNFHVINHNYINDINTTDQYVNDRMFLKGMKLRYLNLLSSSINVLLAAEWITGEFFRGLVF